MLMKLLRRSASARVRGSTASGRWFGIWLGGHLLALLTLWSVGAALGWAQEKRIWTDDTGNFKVEAELKELKRDAVVLILPDGSTKNVPLERLSAEDRKFVAELRQQRQAEMAERRAQLVDSRKRADDVKDEVKALLDGYAMRLKELAESEPDRAQLSNRALQMAQEVAAEAMKLVEVAPQSDLAKEVYLWTIRTARQGPAAEQAAGLMVEHFVDSPEIMQVAQMLRPGSSRENDALLDRIMTTSSDNSVKGVVTFIVARSLSMQEAPAAEARCVELLDQVIQKYAEVLDPRQQPLGPQAERLLFAVQNLKVGKVAPDIQGADLDGVGFKLSDYRGKVVVLDFWGDW
jgi:hypothetical protein